jgi:hypothetical protein
MKHINKNDHRWPGWQIAAFILFICISGTHVLAQQASPMQAGHYYPGLINTRDMVNPPSGLFFLWDNFVVNSNKYFDRNGNEFNNISLSELNPAFPDIDVSPKLTGFGSAFVLAWASHHISFLGDARYIAGMGPNYVSANISILTERPGIVLDTTYTNEISGTVSGFGDLILVPFGLSWGGDRFDFTTMYTIYAPTGRFEPGAEDNIGLGYWTHQFQGFTAYYPVPDKSTALVLGLTYETNGKVKDTDMKPGNRFTMEYGVSQFLSEKIEVGIFGGNNWQVSDDKGDDVFWDPSYYDRKSLLFFNVSYWPIFERLMINFKYGFDYGARQRFKNNTYVLNLLFNPNLLTSD